MLKTNQQYREQAKSLMVGKYKNVIIIMIIISVISGGLSSLMATQNASSSLAQIVNLAFSAGIAYALVAMWRNIVAGKESDLKDTLLMGFKENYVRNLFLYFLQNLFIFLWALLLIVPGVVKSYAYSMAFYLTHREPGIEAQAAIKKSMELTNGKKMQMFMLDLSYLPAYFLGIFTFGIYWLWVYPKHMTARMGLMEDIYTASVPAPIAQ
jgi:uncharacterized membrane protein